MKVFLLLVLVFSLTHQKSESAAVKNKRELATLVLPLLIRKITTIGEELNNIDNINEVKQSVTSKPQFNNNRFVIEDYPSHPPEPEDLKYEPEENPEPEPEPEPEPKPEPERPKVCPFYPPPTEATTQVTTTSKPTTSITTTLKTTTHASTSVTHPTAGKPCPLTSPPTQTPITPRPTTKGPTIKITTKATTHTPTTIMSTTHRPSYPCKPPCHTQQENVFPFRLLGPELNGLPLFGYPYGQHQEVNELPIEQQNQVNTLKNEVLFPSPPLNHRNHPPHQVCNGCPCDPTFESRNLDEDRMQPMYCSRLTNTWQPEDVLGTMIRQKMKIANRVLALFRPILGSLIGISLGSRHENRLINQSNQISHNYLNYPYN